MSDEEQEREAREYLARQRQLSAWAREDNCDRLVVLLRLLDAERAESARRVEQAQRDGFRDGYEQSKRDGWCPWHNGYHRNYICTAGYGAALPNQIEQAVAQERERLGFGEIVMMSEQRNRPGLPPRWCALARGRRQTVLADSEEEARIAAMREPIVDAIESGRPKP